LSVEIHSETALGRVLVLVVWVDVLGLEDRDEFTDGNGLSLRPDYAGDTFVVDVGSVVAVDATISIIL
jgi:hypothetical protein